MSFWNKVVELLQGAPQFLAALLKSGTDLELTGWRVSSTESMSSNISDLLPKKSDNPSEKVSKTSLGLDDTKTPLVTTTDTFVKEGNNNMVVKKGKQNLMW